jgi:hypothetical protein
VKLELFEISTMGLLSSANLQFSKLFEKEGIGLKEFGSQGCVPALLSAAVVWRP